MHCSTDLPSAMQDVTVIIGKLRKWDVKICLQMCKVGNRCNNSGPEGQDERINWLEKSRNEEQMESEYSCQIDRVYVWRSGSWDKLLTHANRSVSRPIIVRKAYSFAIGTLRPHAIATWQLASVACECLMGGSWFLWRGRDEQHEVIIYKTELEFQPHKLKFAVEMPTFDSRQMANDLWEQTGALGLRAKNRIRSVARRLRLSGFWRREDLFRPRIYHQNRGKLLSRFSL